MALGRIPDPFVGDNEKRLGWVAEADWDYRIRFTPTPELLRHPHCWLVCDGLDTLATVHLNGSEVGRADNMFRQYRWDVSKLLKASENDLRISFKSLVRFAAGKQAIRPLPGVPQAIPGGPHLRKAPCQFGWDWGPQLPPIGIWKDIRLEGYDGARIADVRISQKHSEGLVVVEAQVALQVWDQAPRSVILSLFAPDEQVFATRAEFSSANESKLQVQITDPQIWWPNGYGSQPLYRASLELRQGDLLLGQLEYQLGLRTIELRQQPDEWGRSFTLIVNGQPIFAKGSNWIPADAFPTRISDAYLEGLIRSAAQTHQNMLRVWGGGFYEEERFYDLCDRYGILVWQEFIFSCSVYPLDDPVFVENVRLEAVENIRRLRHRASLALWCGNNEMELGWVDWGWKGAEFQDLKAAYDKFFHHILPSWVVAEDPDHAYWPSSPSSDTPFENPNGQLQGDAHYWDVWHGRKPFTAYRSQFPRFMSEFGFQALPPLATIRTYADEAEWNMTSYIMECHQKNASGNALMVSQMLDTFRLPKDFESLVYLSMILQAEGIRYGVEHWRRYPKRVSGTLYWQLNDCWPVASWSSLDFFGRWKALHYAARRFYAPLLLSIEDTPTEQNVFITNETPQTFRGSVRWQLETLDGKALQSGEESIEARPFDVTLAGHHDFSALLNDDLRRQVVFIAELWQAGQILSRQTAYFVPTKHLSLADPAIAAHVRVSDGLVYIEFTARSLARLVEVAFEGADVVFSDNYFDSPAGCPVSISAPLPAGWTLSQVQAALKVRSVYDSFAHGATK
jgi:beta-mannosidase